MTQPELVSVLDYSDAIADLRYSSANNFVKKQISLQTKPLLKVEVAKALGEVADQLAGQKLRLVIWDAYRSSETQSILKAKITDEHYVLRRSNHELGIAIDVTLAALNGEYLDMGTDFDEFSPKAHSDAHDISQEQAKNRIILKKTMERCGFKQWPYEWWHFDYRPKES